MNDVWREWLELAEQDLATARREAAVAVDPNLRSVCFHAQQAAEKLMKAILVRRRVSFPRTHNLLELNRLLTPLGVSGGLTDLELVALTRGAVAVRYPGEEITPEEAWAVLDAAVRLREALTPHLRGEG